MNVLGARYFDGRRSIGHDVSVVLGSGALKIVGRDVDLHFDPRRVRVAPRVANAPRWIYLPGGGACALRTTTRSTRSHAKAASRASCTGSSRAPPGPRSRWRWWSRRCGC